MLRRLVSRDNKRKHVLNSSNIWEILDQLLTGEHSSVSRTLRWVLILTKYILGLFLVTDTAKTVVSVVVSIAAGYFTSASNYRNKCLGHAWLWALVKRKIKMSLKGGPALMGRLALNLVFEKEKITLMTKEFKLFTLQERKQDMWSTRGHPAIYWQNQNLVVVLFAQPLGPLSCTAWPVR